MAAAQADLAVTKTASAAVVAGNNLTYAIVVSNVGPDAAANVSLTDGLPANTTFVSLVAPGGWATTTPPIGGTGNVTATNPSLANGGTASFTLVVQVNGGASAGTVITNTVNVSSSTVDPNAANNSSTAVTAVSAAAVSPTPIPTLSEWALISLSALFGGLAVWQVRRRRQ